MHPLKSIVILLLLNVLIHSQTKGKHVSVSIDLIHLNSQLSPFYNDSLTSSELLKNDILHSLNRVNLFHSSLHINAKDIMSILTPNLNNYLLKFYIGSEKVEVLAVADTGSDLTWIQCDPCHQCYHQDAPFFYPKLSTTYEKLDYDTRFCQHLEKKQRSFDICNYSYSYNDGSYTSGILSTETLYLDSTKDEENTFHKFVFGCGHNNNGKFNSRTQGVVGLGRGPLSLVSQLKAQIDQKFSYCLVPLEEKTASKLIFGTRAGISREGLVSTPFAPQCLPPFYCVLLESVSVGNERATFGFRNRHDIIMDSGTTLTLLHSTLYNKLEAIIKNTIGINTNPVPDPTKIFHLCYEKNIVAGVKFPNMIFHFAGADLHLPPKNTFASYNNMYCMMIVPTNRLSIFGSMSQANFLVEYDLLERKISFAPAKCSAL